MRVLEFNYEKIGNMYERFGMKTILTLNYEKFGIKYEKNGKINEQ